MTDYRRGNCYVATEALFHILGGRRAGWRSMRVTLKEKRFTNQETHWYLLHRSGVIVDPSKRQFNSKGWWTKPDYSKGIGSGFLTRLPSKRARKLIHQLTWQRFNKPLKSQGRRAQRPRG